MSSSPRPAKDMSAQQRARSTVLGPVVHVGFAVLLLLVGLGAWLNYRHTRILYRQQSIVSHTRQVIGQLRLVQGGLIDAETAVRGYLITKNASFLEPYDDAHAQLGAHAEKLIRLVATEPAQLPAVAALIAKVQESMGNLDRLVASAKGGTLGSERGESLDLRDKILVDSVRDSVQSIEAQQEALLNTRQVEASGSYRTAQSTGLAVAACGLFFVISVYNLVRKYDRLRSGAANNMIAARERFEAALTSIGDAVLVIDGEGRLEFCNEGCRSLLSIGSDRIGAKLDELFRLTSKQSSQDTPHGLARRLGGTHRGSADTLLERPDGTHIPVDVTAASLKDDGSSSRSVILILRDESERRQRSLDLARSNDRFQALILATSQIVWTTDADGYVREDSPSWRALTGQTYEQWRGHGWLDALHPEDRVKVLSEWQRAVRNRVPYEGEYRLRLADGTYRWNSVRGVPVLDPQGAIREWVGMNLDVQVRKDAEQAEERAARRKEEFIALLAHELRNPLAPIRNSVEVLRSVGGAERDRAIDMVDRQLRQMVRLIDDLLEVSRIRQGKLELKSEPVDLGVTLAQCAEAIEPIAKDKDIAFHFTRPKESLWVIGDPVRLAQIVTNLLNNAVKYSPEGSSVWLSGEREGLEHVVRVRDTGQGIPPDLQPKIWDLFLQGAGRLERGERGLGIGLTLVRRLVDMHAGQVSVHSEGAGTGSEFEVRLPATGAPVVTAAAAPREQNMADVPKLRILVVDDNEDSAESLAMLLRIGGHSVRVAYSGGDGIATYSSFAPHLVLCDLRMPDLSGHDVAQRLRPMIQEHPTLLVALTGFGSRADREASAQAGFDQHLVKPVDPEALGEVIRSAAARFVKGSAPT